MINKLMINIDRVLIFFICYTFLFLLFFSTLTYTLPFVLAIICALILKKPTKILVTKFNFKNTIASLLTTIIFFTIVILILGFGIGVLAHEAIQLGKSAQSHLSTNSSYIYNLIDKLHDYYNNLDPYIIDALQKNFLNSLTKITNITVNITGKIVSVLLGFIGSIPYILMVILFTFLSTYFFTKDIISPKNIFLNLISEDKTSKVSFIYTESKKMLTNYLLSYLLIITVTFIETIIVFLIFDIKYSFILSLICAIADILPILGIGFVYIPLILIYFFFIKNYVIAFGLIISYVLVSVIRQIIEPKIVSSSLGLSPVAVLAAIFIGLKANGISGMFFCMFLVVFYTIFRKVNIL